MGFRFAILPAASAHPAPSGPCINIVVADLGGQKRTSRSEEGASTVYSAEAPSGKTSTTPRQGEDTKRTRSSSDKHPAHIYQCKWSMHLIVVLCSARLLALGQFSSSRKRATRQPSRSTQRFRALPPFKRQHCVQMTHEWYVYVRSVSLRLKSVLLRRCRIKNTRPQSASSTFLVVMPLACASQRGAAVRCKDHVCTCMHDLFAVCCAFLYRLHAAPAGWLAGARRGFCNVTWPCDCLPALHGITSAIRRAKAFHPSIKVLFSPRMLEQRFLIT